MHNAGTENVSRLKKASSGKQKWNNLSAYFMSLNLNSHRIENKSTCRAQSLDLEPRSGICTTIISLKYHAISRAYDAVKRSRVQIFTHVNFQSQLMCSSAFIKRLKIFSKKGIC